MSWWRGEGNADDSIGPNGGTVQGGVTFVPGKVGQAFAFDGTSADVLIQTSTTLNLSQGFTFAFWIRMPAWPSVSTLIMAKWVSGGENKSVAINAAGQVSFYLEPTTSNGFFSATALTTNVWHFVVETYDGATENIYIDGHFDASDPASGNVMNSIGELSFAHSASLASAYSTLYNTYFAGNLDEIRWYSRALSAAEVTALMSAD